MVTKYEKQMRQPVVAKWWRQNGGKIMATSWQKRGKTVVEIAPKSHNYTLNAPGSKIKTKSWQNGGKMVAKPWWRLRRSRTTTP